MHVFIDTTEFYRDPHLSGVNWKIMESFLQREAWTLHVPQIVIEEAVRHFSQKVTENHKIAQKVNGQLRKMMPDNSVFEIPSVDIRMECNTYRHSLDSRMSNLHAVMPHYSDISIESIVLRSLEGRKPFDDRGHNGFRDAIIWESIVNALDKYDGPCVFITGNTSDFGPHDGLDSSLRSELESLGYSVDRIVVCQSVDDFVEKYAKPLLSRLEEIVEAVRSHRYSGFNAYDEFDQRFTFISDAISNSVSEWDFHGVWLPPNGDYEDPVLQSLDKENVNIEFERDSIYRISESTITFKLDYLLSGVIEAKKYLDTETRSGRTYIQVNDISGNVVFIVTVVVLIDEVAHSCSLDVLNVNIKPDLCSWPCEEDRYD